MRHTNSTDSADQTGPTKTVVGMPFAGGYLTDGETLFRIERTLVGDSRGELLVELEDCATLELIVCAARSVGDLGLRPVQPLTQSQTS